MMNDVKFTLFTNNVRGIYSLKYLIKKKIKPKNVFIASKNLNKDIIKIFKKSKLNYSILKSIDSKEALNILKKTDMGLVCGFPYILKERHLRLVKYGFLNLHAGLLPKYRGGSPLNWQIINNEKFFGISVIKLNKEIDDGDIVEEKKFRLLKRYKIEDLHRIANKNFGKMLFKSIIKILAKKKLKKQSKKNSNYFRQRNLKDSEIIPNKTTLKDLKLLDRAMSKSYPRPFFFHASKKIIINKFRVVKTASKNNSNFFRKNNKIFLKLKDHTIEIK